MTENNSAKFPPLISREQAGNAVRKALRLYVGHGRHLSVKQLANGTGVKDRMIECAMIDPVNIDYRPLPEWALFSIAKFLGPGFTNVWLALFDQVAIEVEGIDLDEVAAKASDYLSAYAQARHPQSEAGIEIGPREASNLTNKAAPLRAVSEGSAS